MMLSFSLDTVRSHSNMRNHSLIFWLLFFVHGVFGADEVNSKSVSVMVGDSVTLHTDDTETQIAEKLQWKIQGENKFIATIDREANKTLVHGNDEERLSGRLDVNSTTGSLTITNLNTRDSRVYELQIKTGRVTKTKIFKVTVHDVVESVSVMEGDSVTLHTGVTEVQRDDVIQWFGDQGTLIARLNSAVDSRWSNVHLNDQTGDLTIRNIQRDQSGVYKMEINTSSMILHKKLRINFSGVFSFDGVKKISVRHGNPVTLQTRITDIPGDDVIEWTFGPQNTSVVKTDRENARLLYNEDDVRFKDRLYLNIQTGDLTISNTKTEVSGLYEIKIIKSTYTIQKSFNVSVSESDQGTSDMGHDIYYILVIVILGLVIVVFLIYCCYRKYKQARPQNATAGEGNGLAKNRVKQKSYNSSSL